MTDKQERSNRLILIWALASGLAVRIFFIEAIVPPIAVEQNGIQFLEMARSLREHGDVFASGLFGNRFERGPFGAWVIAGFSFVFDYVRAGRYASLVAGCAVIVLAYVIARMLAPNDRRVAGLAALTTAWFPLMVEQSVLSYDDMQACFWFTLALAIFAHAADSDATRRWRHAALIGIVVGLGYLTRPTGLAMIGVAFVVWGLFAWLEKTSLRGWLVLSAISLGTFAIVATPYIVFVSRMLGHFSTTAKSMSTFIWIIEGVNRASELVGDDLWTTVALRETTTAGYVAAHWRQVAIAALTGTQWMITDHIGHTLSLPIAAIAFYGFITGPWDRAQAKRVLPIVLALTSLIVPLCVFGTLTTRFGRYLLPIIPIALVWFSKGFFELIDRVAIEWSRTVRNAGLALLGLYFVAGVAAGPGLKLGASLDREHLQLAAAAGDWIASNAPADAGVCSANPTLAFSANRPNVPTPWYTAATTAEQMNRYLDRYGVGYLALDTDQPNTMEFESLLDDLELMHTEHGPSYEIRVYRRSSQTGRTFAAQPAR